MAAIGFAARADDQSILGDAAVTLHGGGGDWTAFAAGGQWRLL
jgi:hypothetical protein